MISSEEENIFWWSCLQLINMQAVARIYYWLNLMGHSQKGVRTSGLHEHMLNPQTHNAIR